MILVGQYDSPYVRRCAVAMDLLDLPFKRSVISVFADADEMRTINPLGRIPSLVLDDGEVLIDSAAILDHLDELVGERALLPPSGAARREALRITALACGAIDKAGAVVYEHSVRPPDKVYEPWVARCRGQLAAGLDALEAETREFWYLGDRPRTPDITVGCLIGYLRHRLPDALGNRPRLAALHDRLDALPAFSRTRPAADEVMPPRPS